MAGTRLRQTKIAFIGTESVIRSLSDGDIRDICKDVSIDRYVHYTKQCKNIIFSNDLTTEQIKRIVEDLCHHLCLYKPHDINTARVKLFEIFPNRYIEEIKVTFQTTNANFSPVRVFYGKFTEEELTLIKLLA